MHNHGNYTSKSYRAYIERVRLLHASDPSSTSTNKRTPFEKLGRALAEHMEDVMMRPGFLRSVFSPEHESVVRHREDTAEISRRVNTIMATVLRYNRKINYQNKSV
jgi:hypothetical protein